MACRPFFTIGSFPGTKARLAGRWATSQLPSSSADFLRIVCSSKQEGERTVAPLSRLPAIGLPLGEEVTQRGQP